ncbi:MAG: ABC transporter substrate-binding protein [Halorhodospira sp.]
MQLLYASLARRASAVLLLLLTVPGIQAGAATGTEEEPARTVVDMLDRQVTLPASVERIATVNVDAFRIALHLGAEEQLVGIPSNMFGSRFAQDKPIEARAFEAIDEVAQIGGGQPGSEVNLERVLATEPDVLLYWSFSRRDDAAALVDRVERLERQLGVPVVALNTLSGEADPEAAVPETIETAYRLMGEITGREARADELLESYRETVDWVQARIAEEDPSPARIYLGHRSNLYNAVTDYLPVKQLGAELVSADRRGVGDGEVHPEELVAWDPEHIFLHTPSQASRVAIDEVLDDERLAGVTAVAEGNVHRFKGTYMGWDVATGLIDLLHMAKILYPEAMAGVDLAEQGRAILERFYGDPELYEHLEAQSSLAGGA